MGRLLRSISLIALMLGCAGCAAPGPAKSLSIPFVKSSQDESLRKQVQSDSFPTAAQAGL